jgi:hypothetical protein
VTVGRLSAFEWYAFPPVRAKYLRVVCHGNTENNWNSIHEVRLESLARDDAEPVVAANEALAEYPAKHTIDGNPETRWAAEGRDRWVQYRLDPAVATDRVGIAWYKAATRQARFEILVSNDGGQWTKVRHEPEAAESTAPDRIDIVREAGGANRVLARRYPVSLPSPGRVEVNVTPVRGKVLLCGAILEPLSLRAD